MIRSIIILCRPHHWVKNLFIFLPAFFASQITNLEILLNSAIAFISFSFIASSIYILNDLFDIKEDKKHPTKRNRPLASGQVPIWLAVVLMGALIGLSLAVALIWLPLNFLWILAIYIVNNLLYNFWLRYISILDVSSIAFGFVVRVFAGSWSTGIFISMWIIIMTFLLALFLGLAKRRDDLLIKEKTGEKMRKAVDGYNLNFVDNAMNLMAGVVIVAYIMYTVSPEVAARLGTENLYFTAFWVILGVLRYMKISLVMEDSASPTKVLLTDRFVQLTILAWACTFWALLYLQI